MCKVDCIIEAMERGKANIFLIGRCCSCGNKKCHKPEIKKFHPAKGCKEWIPVNEKGKK